MKELIKSSFEQNPQVLQRLLATGNATLTHTQDKTKWGTEFPRLLMEVREELRTTQSIFSSEKQERLTQLEKQLEEKGLGPNEVGELNKLRAEKGKQIKKEC